MKFDVDETSSKVPSFVAKFPFLSTLMNELQFIVCEACSDILTTVNVSIFTPALMVSSNEFADAEPPNELVIR